MPNNHFNWAVTDGCALQSFQLGSDGWVVLYHYFNWAVTDGCALQSFQLGCDGWVCLTIISIRL